MTKSELLNMLNNGPVFLDGATGTNLMKAGLEMGVCPEDWIYNHPDAIIDLQKRYVAAGSNIVYAPTFTANRIKLAEYGLVDRLTDINRMMVRLSRQAVDGKALVAGDLTMTGQQLYPTGDLMFEELVDVYKEQVRAINEEGVDLYVVETMMSLQECRAAVIAIKEVSPEIPVIVTLTYNEDGRTLYGTRPDTAVIVLQSLGVDVVGINCSTGPEDMIPLVQQMAAVAKIPLLAKPNAGLPILEDGVTVYKMTPEEFANDCEKLFEAGASVLGGCCGTTPEHIAALTAKLAGRPVALPDTNKVVPIITSERANTHIDVNGKFICIGERINPTGKKKLQEELRNGSLNMVCEFAREQEAAGAAILDVNMGMNGIDEKQMMLDAIYEVTSTVDLPLCIDTSHVDIMEAALRIYPGRALINSISCEEGKMNEMLAIAKKYGAMFVLLPLSGAGLPKDLDEKKQHIHTVLDAAKALGMQKEDAVVDILVQTVGANADAAKECFETIEYCKNELGLPTTGGLSNISFGMPSRTFVNASFLTIALSKGLTSAIANPSQDILMFSAMAADLLMNKEGASEKYLDKAPTGNVTLSGGVVATEKKEEVKPAGPIDMIKECVVKGSKEMVVEEVKRALDAGETPSEIVENHLIAGINEVGDLYDKKKYFLPQLIAGANAMKAGMDYLEPLLLAGDKGEPKATIVFATVEGDIHDIGKNLVVLMLKNYGFNVIDMGKDIKAVDIVDKAMEVGAEVIGLSALMTTTMMKMKEVVDVAKEKGCTAKIIIGGACITESFKDEIGADGYSADAADCVKLVKSLLYV